MRTRSALILLAALSVVQGGYARSSRCTVERIDAFRSAMTVAYESGNRSNFRTEFESFRSQCGMLSYDPIFSSRKELLRDFYWTVQGWMDLAGKMGDHTACIERGTSWIYQFPSSNLDSIERETPNVKDALVHALEECQRERFAPYAKVNTIPCASGENGSVELPAELKKLFPSAPWAAGTCVGYRSPIDSPGFATPPPGFFITDSSGLAKPGIVALHGEPLSCGSLSVRFYRAPKEERFFLHAKGTSVPCRKGSAIATFDALFEWTATGLREVENLGVALH
jgi:hypothetical protein